MNVLSLRRVLVLRRPVAQTYVSFALGLSLFAATFGLAASNGGFFPSSWGWSALALLCVSIAALVFRQVEKPRALEIAFAGSITAVAGWTWLSVAWSSARTESVLEGERALVLVGRGLRGIDARRRTPRALSRRRNARGNRCRDRVCPRNTSLPGSLRLRPPRRLPSKRPDRLLERTQVPFTAMGVLLAFGVVARADRLVFRALAAAGLVVLLPVMYYTFSRGSWLALGVGLVVLIALDPRRLEATVVLFALGVLPALAVLLDSRPNSLTRSGSSLAQASHDGHRLALVLAGLAVVQVLVAVGLAAAESRLHVPRRVRLAYGGSLLACVGSVGGSRTVVREGNPVSFTRHAYRSLSPPRRATTRRISTRASSACRATGAGHSGASPGRRQLRIQLLGGGAGTFGEYWTQHRPINLDVEDAHSLYLETLAELGRKWKSPPRTSALRYTARRCGEEPPASACPGGCGRIGRLRSRGRSGLGLGACGGDSHRVARGVRLCACAARAAGRTAAGATSGARRLAGAAGRPRRSFGRRMGCKRSSRKQRRCFWQRELAAGRVGCAARDSLGAVVVNRLARPRPGTNGASRARTGAPQPNGGDRQGSAQLGSVA